MICDDILKIIVVSIMVGCFFVSFAFTFIFYAYNSIKDYYMNKRNDKFLDKLQNLQNKVPHHIDYQIDNLECKFSSLDSRLSILENLNCSKRKRKIKK